MMVGNRPLLPRPPLAPPPLTIGLDDVEGGTGGGDNNNNNNNVTTKQPKPKTTTRPTIRLLASSSTLSDDSGDHNTTGTNTPEGMDMDYGLMVSINNNSSTTTTTTTTADGGGGGGTGGGDTIVSRCEVAFCADANFRMIHPNMYAPDALSSLQKLGGGGSGVAVFSGEHPKLGSLVMKHGGYKDMTELFALATIAQELKFRGGLLEAELARGHPLPESMAQRATAAQDMQRRIPEFKMIYMSPYHFRSRGAEFWGNLKQIIKNWSLFSLPGVGGGDSSEDLTTEQQEEQGNEDGCLSPTQKRRQSVDTPRISNATTTATASFRRRSSSPSGNLSKLSTTTTPTYSPIKRRQQQQQQKYPQQQEDVATDLPAMGSLGSPLPWRQPLSPTSPRVKGTTIRPSAIIRQINPHGLNFGRSIRLYEGAEDNFSFQLDGNCESVALVFAKDSCDFLSDGRTVQLRGDSYDALKIIVDELLPLMTDQLFKFTLGQKTIGGEHAMTGNQLLYAGQLHGDLLDTLITQMIQVIRNLQLLTLPEEVDVVDIVRAEVAQFESERGDGRGGLGDDDGDYENGDDDGYGNTMEASDISKVADMFVGNAIRKNFHPTKGRQRLLEVVGEMFRNRPDSLLLTPDEELPAMHLGAVLQRGALMGDTFENVPQEPTALQPDNYFWRNILKRAVEYRPGQSPASLQRVWTCGLADAGIHNLFLSPDTVWLFDLGEPQLQSLPGFLTKFLFSFFHTLGMQEPDEDPLDPQNPNKDWVRRFVPSSNNKLALTEETVDLLPKAYNAFEVCLDRIIDDLFEGDNSLRWLLIQYVTLQLLSDTAFCLQRWQVKGGGRERKLNHNKGIEKWLWRALWDVYVAYDINTRSSWSRFRVEPPSPSPSVASDTR